MQLTHQGYATKRSRRQQEMLLGSTSRPGPSPVGVLKNRFTSFRAATLFYSPLSSLFERKAGGRVSLPPPRSRRSMLRHGPIHRTKRMDWSFHEPPGWNPVHATAGQAMTCFCVRSRVVVDVFVVYMGRSSDQS